MNQNNPLENLIKQIASLPGLGNRSARRIALHLLQKKDTSMLPLAHALQDTAEKIQNCSDCGNLDLVNPCQICADHKRDRSKLCVVAQVSDLWAIERTHAFKGQYYILGGLLSALDGIGPEELRIDRLMARAEELSSQELILALSATVDGQTTAHYIADRFATTTIDITRLAHGVPVGGELDYLDEGTIVTALNSRSAA